MGVAEIDRLLKKLEMDREILAQIRSGSMTPTTPQNPDKPQTEKFEEAARALECGEDEARWNERLKKVAKQNLAADPRSR